jgi:excisionase family DNA binding protein
MTKTLYFRIKPPYNNVKYIRKEDPRMKELMTVSDVARILKVKKTTAYQVMHTRGFPALRIRRSLRVSEEAFADWLREKEKGP